MASTQGEATSKPDGLRRELYPRHIFAIAISAVIGMGFYVRVGVLDHLGGQAAVIYAYGFLGALCLMVMTCLAVMLRIWPIAGALVVFVGRFVDPDIGQSVGVLYWLTYCFSFAGLTTAIGGLVSDLHLTKGQSVIITVASLVMPILFNLTDIRVFRKIELILVSVKLSIVVVIIIIMNVINPEVGGLVTTQTPQVQPKDIIFQKPNEENWFGVLMASIFLASFSYVGVEVVAATAQEAKGGNTNQSKTNADGEDSTGQRLDPLMTRRDGEGFPLVPIGSEPFPDAAAASSIRSLARQHADADTESEDDGSDALSLSGHHRKSPFQSPARYVPIVSAVLYLWGAWIVTQNVAWDDSSQPSLAGSSSGWSSSIFINSARKSSVPGLDRALTGLLIVNIASTSSTALYVASRTLFGLTFTISKDMERKPPSELWRKRWLDFMKLLSRKSKFDVPYIAVLVSAWGLILPFLKYAKGNSYLTAIDVVTEMGSVSCILVWGWESFAAFRFFKCCKRHPEALGVINENIVRYEDKWWYFFHLSMSLFAAIMCPTIVFVGGAFTVVHNNNATQGVATFLVVAIFLGLTFVLKVIRWALDPHPWWRSDRFLRDLKVGANVKDMFKELNTLATKHIDKNHEPEPRSWYDVGGILDSEWLFNKLRGRN